MVVGGGGSSRVQQCTGTSSSPLGQQQPKNEAEQTLPLLTVPQYPHRPPSAACSAPSSAGAASAGRRRPPRSVPCP